MRLPGAAERQPKCQGPQVDPSFRSCRRMAIETAVMMMVNTQVTFSPIEKAAPEFRM